VSELIVLKISQKFLQQTQKLRLKDMDGPRILPSAKLIGLNKARENILGEKQINSVMELLKWSLSRLNLGCGSSSDLK